jgi:hypothetical protein
MFTPELPSGIVDTALTEWRVPDMSLRTVLPAGGGRSHRATTSGGATLPPD